MTKEETRKYCTQPSAGLAVDEDDCLYYDSPDEDSFFIKYPSEHRQIVKLSYDLLTISPINCFDGGMIWLHGWQYGPRWMTKPGWRIIEDMRRAHGDQNSLDIAPAQYFREDEMVELHASLIQLVAYEWPAYYLPRGSRFFVDYTGERVLVHSKDSGMLEELYSGLASWGPGKEDPDAARTLAITHYEAARKRMEESDLPGAIELFRSSLKADPEFYDAARGLISALEKSGQNDEALKIARILAEFTAVPRQNSIRDK